MQVEFTGFAYKTSEWESVERMLNGEKMPYVTEHNREVGGTHTKDWVKLGTVRVIVEFDDKETIVSNQLEALKAQLHTVRAENQLRENKVIDQIKNLQAITNEVKA